MRQRGIAQGWLILLALVALAGAAWWAYNVVDGRGYDRGKAEVEAAVLARDNAALEAANKRIQALQDAARKAEQQHAVEINQVAEQFQKEARNAKQHSDRVISGLRDGTRKLYVDVAARCPAQGGGRGVPEARAGAALGDGTARAELSEPASQFLVAEAVRADGIAIQLGACQAVIDADRKVRR